MVEKTYFNIPSENFQLLLPVMFAILYLRQILNMSRSMGNMHSENEKYPAIDYKQHMLFSILTSNYRLLSPLMAAILLLLKFNFCIIIDNLHSENENDHAHIFEASIFQTSHTFQYFSCKLSIIITSNGSHIRFF